MPARLIKITSLCLGLAIPSLLPANTPDLPDGYTLQYEQSFDSKDSFEEFMMTDRSAWNYTKVKGNGVLSLEGKSEYEPPHRSPYNIALIKGRTFGDFVMDVDIQQTGVKGTPIAEYMQNNPDLSKGGGYAHRDHCFFFGFEDPSHFMYIHVAKTGDNNAHNVFVVNEAPRTPITDFRTIGADWGVEEWRKIRIVRDTKKGTVALYFDDMLTPIMIADDIPFKQGFIGFGSFDDIGWVDNIKIWAPEVNRTKRSFFN
ncbi:hypothetical protein [Pelagicoccus mobilis]|uniref:Uncharacterized protein n=1 Tax=Pelagicoccus mobilis TaxID=415221 RepID=A0A934VT97_9BACT|nr:hypothetical protein [Pelagicoccus mobilis]MBK1879845.1 hypothetical protein [Pelagicoccus mobilis]